MSRYKNCGKHPNSRKNLVAAWRKGQSGNPGGRPKVDIAAQLARAVFEENQESIYKALTKGLLKGNAYLFKELANRGYGRIKETLEHVDTIEMSIDEVRARILEILKPLGDSISIETPSGRETPLIGPDGVKAKTGPLGNETVAEKGQKAKVW